MQAAPSMMLKMAQEKPGGNPKGSDNGGLTCGGVSLRDGGLEYRDGREFLHWNSYFQG